MTREGKIQARARYLSTLEYNLDWVDLHPLKKKQYIQQATADVDWFEAHQEYVPAKIPENPYPERIKHFEGLDWYMGDNPEYINFSRIIEIFQSANPGGLWTKEK